jgi:general secretion pathway protein E
LAQRLIRKVCPDCKKAYHPDDEELIRLGVVPGKTRPTFYRGTGCAACSQTGYRGRTGIHELLVMDDEVRRLIGCKADSAAIKQAAIAKGMIMLKEEAAEKIFAGITTTEEVMRMTQQEVEV